MLAGLKRIPQYESAARICVCVCDVFARFGHDTRHGDNFKRREVSGVPAWELNTIESRFLLATSVVEVI
jgi:hypothetical protein